MTKRIRKIGIAARLTAVVAVILAVFVGLWTFKLIENAQVVAAYRAGMEVNDICWRVEHTLVEKGYDPDDMPSANTPEYDKMRCDLAYSIWDSEKAYVVQYYDGQENWVTMRSPLLLYGKNADADIDISNFAEQDIREMREVYGPKKGFSDDVGYIAMIYGKKIENNGHTIYIPNRICVGAYDYEWTAQTPVEEVGQWEEMPQWCFDKDSNMEVYFAEKKYLETKLRCINGENVKVDHTGGYFTIFLSLSSTIGYGHGMVMATAPIDKEAAYEDLFWGMPFITIALYLIFLFIFYKIVRRMVADPLVDTAREANLVANLAFDEFKPDLKRGDEIGELNRALSEMASTLHARWDSERDLEDKRQQFASLLRQKESFFLYGAGFSYLFAEYLTKKLQVLGKTAFISGPGDSRNIFLSNAARYQVFIAVSRSGETEQVLDKARIAKNVGMTIVAFTRASANTLAGMADVHFALYDEAVHFAAEAAGVTSFESNLVLLMDLLLLEATG